MTDASGTSGPDRPDPSPPPATAAQPAPVPTPAPGAPPGVPGVPGVPTAGPAPYAQLPYGHTPYHQNPYGAPAYGMPGYGAPLRDPDARPGTVLAAGVVTLVLSGLVLLTLLVVLFFMLVTRADFMEGFGDQAGMRSSGADTWYTVILVVVLASIVWCLAAIVLAILTLRRSNVARICLVVSSGFTAALSLVAITGGVSLITLVGSVAVIVLLFTGGAGDWFHREHLYSPPRLPPL